MAPGDHIPPSRGSTHARMSAVSPIPGALLVRVTEYTERVCRQGSLEIALTAAAVFADAPTVAESSRDVSDLTSRRRTLTPGSVRGSLTSRLRV